MGEETEAERKLQKIETFEIEAAPLVEKDNHDGTVLAPESPSPTGERTWWEILNPMRLIFGNYIEREKEHEEDHRRELQASKSEDFSDLEMLQLIQTGYRDKEGLDVVMIIGKHLPITVIDQNRLYRFLVHKLNGIVERHFAVVYVHTGSSYWENSPGIRWLWNSYDRLPARYRMNMQKLYILHPDLQLHASMWLVCRWFRDGFWGKVHFVWRVEFLWDHFEEGKISFPSFVTDHDGELENHPLMDYGIITNREWAPPGGPDLARYQ